MSEETSSTTSGREHFQGNRQTARIFLLFSFEMSAWTQQQACDQNNSCGFTLPAFAGIFALQHQLFSISNGKITLVFFLPSHHILMAGKQTANSIYSHFLTSGRNIIYCVYCNHTKTCSPVQILNVSERKCITSVISM